MSSASSSSSYSASLICVPVKTVAMELPVLRRPMFRRSIQPWRVPSGLGVGSGTAGGACSGAGWAWGAAAGALVSCVPKDLRSQPSAPPPLEASAAGATSASGALAASGAGALEGSAGEGDFFLKKLNIGRYLESQPFYETRYHPFGPAGLPACGGADRTGFLHSRAAGHHGHGDRKSVV